MQRVLGLVAVLLSAHLARAEPLPAQDEDGGPASLTVCNNWNRGVSVALGVANLDPLGPPLTVVGWSNVAPGKCAPVYDHQSTSYIPAPSYLAFAYFDSQQHFVAARMATVPDIGAWSHHSTFMALKFPEGSGPALTRVAKTLCVNADAFEYAVPRESQGGCGEMHPDGVPGALVPIVAQVFFHPSARRCHRNASYEEFRCGGGIYYLDVAPRTGDLDLRASHSAGHEDESVAVQRTPEENARDLAEGVKLATDAARGFAGEGKLPGTHEPSPWDEVRPQFWQGAMQSVSAYQPSWLGQVVVVRGTVSRINEQAQWTTISFKESPKGALTLCAMWANVLRRTLAVDLQTLVGKTLEFTGQVEEFEPCSKGATIRVLEPEQVRMGTGR